MGNHTTDRIRSGTESLECYSSYSPLHYYVVSYLIISDDIPQDPYPLPLNEIIIDKTV